jgi:hypothetical protein
MSALTQWVTAARAVDLALLFMLAEAALLLAYRWRTERGPSVGEVLSMLLPGICLLVALRAAVQHMGAVAVTDAGTVTIMALLAAALLAHLNDLQRRWGYG